MAKRLTEKQKKLIITSFKDGSTIEHLSKEFECTDSTIIRNLKKYLGDKESTLSKFLISHSKNEIAIEITQKKIFHYDYSKRMKGINYE